jgi:hypothetical protein
MPSGNDRCVRIAAVPEHQLRTAAISPRPSHGPTGRGAPLARVTVRKSGRRIGINPIRKGLALRTAHGGGDGRAARRPERGRGLQFEL